MGPLKMTRRTPDETKQLLLRAGLELLHERGTAPGVSHIRLQDVVAHAGLTTGAAYRLWINQAEFHRDLATLAISWSDNPPTTDTISRIRTAVEQGAPFPEVLQVGAEVYLHDEKPNPAFLISLALRATAPNDDTIRSASRRRHDDTIDAHVELYEGLLHWYRRKMRPPYTTRDVALALAATSEGLALQAIAGERHPRFATCAPGDDQERDWSLLGIIATMLVDAMTEPADEPD